MAYLNRRQLAGDLGIDEGFGLIPITTWLKGLEPCRSLAKKGSEGRASLPFQLSLRRDQNGVHLVPGLGHCGDGGGDRVGSPSGYGKLGGLCTQTIGL